MELSERLLMWGIKAGLLITVFLLNQKVDNLINQNKFINEMYLMKMKQHEPITYKLHATDTLLYNRFLKLEQNDTKTIN